MLSRIFGFFNTPQRVRTRPNCPYCHGVKCMGACGNSPDEYKDASICGTVSLPSEHMGIIECDEGRVYNFEARSELGREILSVCPAASRCQVEAQHHEGTLKFVIYIERL